MSPSSSGSESIRSKSQTPKLPPQGTTRRAVFDYVARYPGVHVRGVERGLGLSSALAHYHLRALSKEGLLVELRKGGTKRFFISSRSAPSSSLSDDDRDLLALLRERQTVRIILSLLEKGPMRLGEISQQTGIQPSTLSYHLSKLVSLGVLERSSKEGVTLFRLVDERRIRALLATHTPAPDLFETMRDIWERFYETLRRREGR